MQKQAILVIVWLLSMIVFPAYAQDSGEAVITSPTSNQQLFGLAQITGSASHPSLFSGYSLDWSNVQNPDVWIPIQPRLSQQVTNGILGQWDTVAEEIPDGVYQIRLQVFLTDGSILESQVTNLALVNSLPTNVPTTMPAVPLVTLAPPDTATIIEQPPTASPQPTIEAVVVSTTATSERESLGVNYSALQSAFCTGVYFTAGLFALIVAYLTIRRQLSPYTRRLWWQIRSELENDEKDY